MQSAIACGDGSARLTPRGLVSRDTTKLSELVGVHAPTKRPPLIARLARCRGTLYRPLSDFCSNRKAPDEVRYLTPRERKCQ